MTRLVWGAVGERYYEAGVDRGVLYVGSDPGVPWSGLVSVKEEPTGGEANPYYIDGVKYLNQAATEEFEATIEAYTYPEKFARCDGSLEASNGLFSTQQTHELFALSYRTLIGNDVEGIDLGYKIHMVYNALASPTAQEHSTIGESVEPDNFSWKITTQPVAHSILGVTSHLVIDSRKTPPDLLADLEAHLYGTSMTAPTYLSVHDLYELFAGYVPLVSVGEDAGYPWTEPTITYDGGNPPSSTQTSTIDGGGV